MEALQQLQQQPMAAQAEHRVTSWQEAKRQPVLPQGAMAEEASMLRQTKLQVVEEAAEVHQASLETLAMGALAACTVAAAAAAAEVAPGPQAPRAARAATVAGPKSRSGYTDDLA